MNLNSYRILDLFCGAGGMSEGFKQVGFNISYAIDKDKDALKTFMENNPNTEILNKDVRKMDFNKFKDSNILLGGFPCKPFSNANRNSTKNHPDKDLFQEYLRAIKEILPYIFIMENVNGILKKNVNKESLLDIIINNTKPLGYNINYYIINMAYWGLPQKRERVIIIGSKINNLNITIYNETNNLGLVTVKDAISDLYFNNISLDTKYSEQIYNKCNYLSEYQKKRRNNSNLLFNHVGIDHRNEFVEKVKCIPQGGNWKNIPIKYLGNHIHTHSNSYKRLSEDNQSPTIAHVRKMCLLHPIQNRSISIREAARLQGFDDSYIFYGSKDSQYQQIANAVPPLFSNHIANDIFSHLSKL